MSLLFNLQAGISTNAVGLKSNSSKDVRGSSPEVMEMNVDLLSMGVSNNGPSPDAALAPHAPTNSNAHGIIFTFYFYSPAQSGRQQIWLLKQILLQRLKTITLKGRRRGIPAPSATPLLRNSKLHPCWNPIRDRTA